MLHARAGGCARARLQEMARGTGGREAGVGAGDAAGAAAEDRTERGALLLLLLPRPLFLGSSSTPVLCDC